MTTPTFILFRPGKGPFKKKELVLCPDHQFPEASSKVGDGFVLLVPQELFDQIEAWRDR